MRTVACARLPRVTKRCGTGPLLTYCALLMVVELVISEAKQNAARAKGRTVINPQERSADLPPRPPAARVRLTSTCPRQHPAHASSWSDVKCGGGGGGASACSRAEGKCPGSGFRSATHPDEQQLEEVVVRLGLLWGCHPGIRAPESRAPPVYLPRGPRGIHRCVVRWGLVERVCP
jgi:hypothetical protein